jgi:tight adherence protein C
MTPAALIAAAAAALGALAAGDLLAARHARRADAAGRAAAAAGRTATAPTRAATAPTRAASRALATLRRLGALAGAGAGSGRAHGHGLAAHGRDVAARLEAAGVSMPAADFALLRGGAAVAGLLAVLPLAWAAPGRPALLVLLAGPAAGHLAPAAWLARRTRRRAALVERELADVLDLLRVAVGAGLSPLRAVGEVGRRHYGALAAELALVAAALLPAMTGW